MINGKRLMSWRLLGSLDAQAGRRRNPPTSGDGRKRYLDGYAMGLRIMESDIETVRNVIARNSKEGLQ